MTQISDLGEFGLIKRLTEDIKLENKSTIIGAGDDCAVMDFADKQVVATSDMLLEGVHFNLVYVPLKHLGYKAARVMTFTMAALILLVFVYAVIVFLVGHPVEGWTTTMLFMGLSFFGIFAIMAVILKYLSLITNLVFKKQEYVFESIEKLVNL